ncbi:nickel/cobalt transporter [Martelella endophytica]|uniref:Nickel/cobalt efflux system n=1 Tax=Martelella endophytica TaxID=1486262 RepID=A0A0D5LPJ4_MAREN|nr:delayed-early response protein/equilibrative nucleoside transporter [Martelella endophytica]
MRLTRPTAILLTLMTLLIVVTSARAQTSPLGIGTAEPSFSSSFGPLQHVLLAINRYQQQFYHALTAALKAMKDDPMKVLGLVGLSFAYGVFHAAGPGHGKAVISSYLIANETELKRGVLISLLASIAQGVSAVLLVGTAYLFLRGTAVSMRDATLYMEQASFLLIAAFGAWLFLSKTRGLFLGPRPALAGGPALAHSHDDEHHAHHHSHNDHHEHHHGHEDHHVHGPDCGCGHAHMPDPSALGGQRFDWKGAGSAILAIGMRPCSGALIVLTFALLNGLILGGIASVFAMAIGTAITVSVLATIAVTAKGLAVRLSGGGRSRANTIGRSIEIAAAFCVMLMGLTLFAASMAA